MPIKPDTISKTVLICPLNWGLGHASRDVIIIKKLLSYGFKVIIGADKAPLYFLQEEFPNLPFIVIPSVEIKYPKGKLMSLKMILSAPKILYGIVKEHQQLKKVLTNHTIDIVISDNRFGLWNKRVYSIFITHQLKIQVPKWIKYWGGIVNKINAWFINKYDLCWIPDFRDKQNVAGKLSQVIETPENFRYIGLLSRFKNELPKQNKYHVLVILSGPEPQRSIFEHILINELVNSNMRVLIILGKPGSEQKYSKKNIDFINHLPSKQLGQLIKAVPIIISRSGYSSIMDYIGLKKNAILVPTPGQTEQEYLAKSLKEKKWFYSVNQKQFNLASVIKQSKKYQIPYFKINNSLLEAEILSLV